MITIAQDGKSPTYIITKTDGEGYSKQINVSKEELDELVRIWNLTRT